MYKSKYVSYFITSLVLLGCSGQPIEDNSMEAWKLSGRFYELAVKEDYAGASLKLDSMDLSTCFLNENIVDKIIEVLIKTNKVSKVKYVLDRLEKHWVYYHLLEAQLENNPIFKDYCEDFTSITDVTHPSIQKKLVKMLIIDQKIRGGDMNELMQRYQITDEELLDLESNFSEEEYNKLELQKILQDVGFPTIRMVGIDGMKGVFFIIQHANHDKEWQLSQLPNIKKSVEDGNLNIADYAFLYDRIRVLKKEHQVYGTQFIIKKNSNMKIQLEAVEDPKKLNKRRKEANLLPIETYLEVIKWEISKINL